MTYETQALVCEFYKPKRHRPDSVSEFLNCERHVSKKLLKNLLCNKQRKVAYTFVFFKSRTGAVFGLLLVFFTIQRI